MPIRDAMSQGRTKKEALEMAADLVESLVNKAEFNAPLHSERDLIALLLRRQREKSLTQLGAGCPAPRRRL